MLRIGSKLKANLITANRSYIIKTKNDHPDAKFYCGDKVRMRDPDTGIWGRHLLVARVQLDEETNGWKYDLNSQDHILVHSGVKERNLKDE